MFFCVLFEKKNKIIFKNKEKKTKFSNLVSKQSNKIKRLDFKYKTKSTKRLNLNYYIIQNIL